MQEVLSAMAGARQRLRQQAKYSVRKAEDLRELFKHASSGTAPCTSCCTQCNPWCCLATY